MPKPPVTDIDRRYHLLGVRVVSEFGAAIAIPVVAASIIGTRLDAKYGTKPAFVIAGFVLAFIVSTVYVVRKARAFSREYETINAATSKPGSAKEGAPDKKT